MRLRKMIGLVLLAILLSACNNDAGTDVQVASNDFNTERFIEDTEEVIAISESVYGEMREPTVEEEVELEYYEKEYGDIEVTNISLVATTAMQLFYDAKRPDGLDDSYAETRDAVERYIGDLR